MERCHSQAICPPVFESLEARCLLSGLVTPIAIEQYGFSFIDRLEAIEPMSKVANGPSPDELSIFETLNVDAADTTNTDELWSGGGLGLALNGNGYTAGVWDAGLVRCTHDEFYDGQTYRVTLQDSGNVGDHATHVAGTIGASGTDADARGMASEVGIWSYTSDNDLAEMATAAQSLVVSNHSYGYIRGWTLQVEWGIGVVDTWYGDRYLYAEDPYFGKYDSNASALDEVLYDHPELLSVWSAGNDRNEEFSNARGDGTYVTYLSGDPGGGWFTGPGWYLVLDSGVTSAPEIDGNGGAGYEGYDSLSQRQTAKNTLVVGAIDDITEDPYDAGDVVMAEFSSWGATDDGRIKPDVVGNGVNVYSSLATADDAYGTGSGTSMAAPNVTGSSVLLIEHYEDLFGDQPLAATTKALWIHTAFDAGNTGPDYQYGWGVADAAAAVDLLAEADTVAPSAWLLENAYSGTEYTWSVASDGTDPLKVTIAWMDPEGTANTGGLDDDTPALVNDLDLWVVGPDSTTYYPWTLDISDPANAAVRTTGNHVDNVEQVLIDSPSAGAYTIHVGRTGSTFTQDYSMIVSGAEEIGAPSTPDLAADSDTGVSNADNVTMYDNGSGADTLDFVVGNTVAGTTVTIYAGVQAVGTATATGTSTTVTTNGTHDLTDGTETIDFTAKLSVGVQYSEASGALSVTIDTQAPSAPGAPDLQGGSDSGVSQTDDETNAVDLIFDVPGGAYFRFYRGASQISGDWETGSTYTAAAEPEGSHQYKLTLVDAAGNESDAGTALPVTVDRTAPSAPEAPGLQAGSDSGIADDDGITNDTTPTFDISGVGGGDYFRFYKDAAPISGDWETGPTYTTPALTDGQYSMTVTAADAAGNESAAGEALSVTIDTVAPTTQMDGLVVNGGASNRSTIGWLDIAFADDVESALDDGDISLSLRHYDGDEWEDPTYVSSDRYDWLGGANNEARWDLWFDNPITLGDGYYIVLIVDAAGNEAEVAPEDALMFFRFQGDLTGDGTVDVYDLSEVANNYNTGSWYPWTFHAGDANLDGTCDVFDLSAVASNYKNSVGDAPDWPS